MQYLPPAYVVTSFMPLVLMVYYYYGEGKSRNYTIALGVMLLMAYYAIWRS